MRRHGPEIVGDALQTIGEAFPDESLANGGALVGAMMLVFAHEADLDRDQLFEALLTRTTEQWSEFANLTHVRSGSRRAQVLRDAFLAVYRDHRRQEAAE